MLGLTGVALAWRARPPWERLLERAPHLPAPDWQQAPIWSRGSAPPLWGSLSPRRAALPTAVSPLAPDLLVYGSPGAAAAEPQALPGDAVLLGTLADFELPRELPPGLASLWLYSLGHTRALAAYELPPDPR